MNTDRVCIANFTQIAKPTYLLTVAKTGDGAGKITTTPAGIDCGNDCTESYDENTAVALTATPENGSTFVGWSGDADCLDGSLTMDAAHHCTAEFAQDTAAEQTLVEAGEVEVDHTWQRVYFTWVFVDPVVIAKPLSANDDDPAVVRISNVDTEGFDIRLQEWDYLDGSHALETVGYLVMERGSHVLPDGTQVEAGRVDTDTTRSFDPLPFEAPFASAPVVFTAVSSLNDIHAVTVQVRNISTDGFEIGMREQESNRQKHGVESLSYIAWEPSSGTLDGMPYVVGRTDDVVTDKTHTITYETPFLAPPVFVADMQTTNDADTANLRWRDKTAASVDVWVDEEQSKNDETRHRTEAVGYALFGKPLPQSEVGEPGVYQ